MRRIVLLVVAIVSGYFLTRIAPQAIDEISGEKVGVAALLALILVVCGGLALGKSTE